MRVLVDDMRLTADTKSNEGTWRASSLDAHSDPFGHPVNKVLDGLRPWGMDLDL